MDNREIKKSPFIFLKFYDIIFIYNKKEGEFIMTITKCDRCGKEISLDDAINLADTKKPWWRYDIYYDAHPYPTKKFDLCINCKKDLYDWIRRIR